jgi:hypothetical protein
VATATSTAAGIAAVATALELYRLIVVLNDREDEATTLGVAVFKGDDDDDGRGGGTAAAFVVAVSATDPPILDASLNAAMIVIILTR